MSVCIAMYVEVGFNLQPLNQASGLGPQGASAPFVSNSFGRSFSSQGWQSNLLIIYKGYIELSADLQERRTEIPK